MNKKPNYQPVFRQEFKRCHSAKNLKILNNDSL